jgi:hypothetical protein
MEDMEFVYNFGKGISSNFQKTGEKHLFVLIFYN